MKIKEEITSDLTNHHWRGMNMGIYTLIATNNPLFILEIELTWEAKDLSLILWRILHKTL